MHRLKNKEEKGSKRILNLSALKHECSGEDTEKWSLCDAIFDVSIQDNLKHFKNSLFLRLKAFDGVILGYQASSRIFLKFVGT